MTERSISQIIADLKATCAPESDVGLLCQFAEQVRADVGRIIAELERMRALPSTVDWEAYHMLDSSLHFERMEKAELRHSLQLANNNAATFQRVANERQEELKLAKEALRWILEEGVVMPIRFINGQQKPFLAHSDDYEPLEPPAHLRATLESVIGDER